MLKQFSVCKRSKEMPWGNSLSDAEDQVTTYVENRKHTGSGAAPAESHLSPLLFSLQDSHGDFFHSQDFICFLYGDNSICCLNIYSKCVAHQYTCCWDPPFSCHIRALPPVSGLNYCSQRGTWKWHLTPLSPVYYPYPLNRNDLFYFYSYSNMFFACYSYSNIFFLLHASRSLHYYCLFY